MTTIDPWPDPTDPVSVDAAGLIDARAADEHLARLPLPDEPPEDDEMPSMWRQRCPACGRMVTVNPATGTIFDHSTYVPGGGWRPGEDHAMVPCPGVRP